MVETIPVYFLDTLMTINLEILSAASRQDAQMIECHRIKELVPKMVFRRRLTQASKIAIELMDQVGFTKGRIMYASAYGELPSTANILLAILNQEGISPTDFQNSVYNTPVSYASILQENTSEILTISSGDNSSDRLLKLGAIKALDGDEILLLGVETLNIEGIDAVNQCIDYLECGVALKVKITQEKATINEFKYDDKLPKSLERLFAIASQCSNENKNIIEVKL